MSVMSKEAAPPLGFGADTTSEGSLALANDGERESEKVRAPLPPLLESASPAPRTTAGPRATTPSASPS